MGNYFVLGKKNNISSIEWKGGIPRVDRIRHPKDIQKELDNSVANSDNNPVV